MRKCLCVKARLDNTGDEGIEPLVVRRCRWRDAGGDSLSAMQPLEVVSELDDETVRTVLITICQRRSDLVGCTDGVKTDTGKHSQTEPGGTNKAFDGCG